MPLQSDRTSPVHYIERCARFRMLDDDRRVLVTVTVEALREFAAAERMGEVLPLQELFVLYRRQVEDTASAAYDDECAAGRLNRSGLIGGSNS
jgi:hypothetical protein